MAQRLEELKPYLPHPNAKSHELISLVLQTKTKTRLNKSYVYQLRGTIFEKLSRAGYLEVLSL